MARITDPLAQSISLALSLPTIGMAWWVVSKYGRTTLHAWRAGAVWSPRQWLIAGIATHFAGSLGDNLYWAVPWTAKFYGCPAEAGLMASGVYFNIFLRQAAGIVAAYCHLRAAELDSDDGLRELNTRVAQLHVAGLFAFAALWGTR